jgi:hypothetical protein
MARTLKSLASIMGIACSAIGLTHIALGLNSVPSQRSASATMDSLTRFFSAIFVGYGVAWLDAARRDPVPATAVRRLAGVFLLGGVGRLASLAARGVPHWFQNVLTGIELVLPPVFFLLADSDERRARGNVAPKDAAAAIP